MTTSLKDHIRINSFTEFTVSETEQISGQTLTHCNLLVLQNLVAAVAQEKLALKFDVSKPTEFAQQEAYLAGKLDAYNYIIECHASAMEIAAEAARHTPQD